MSQYTLFFSWQNDRKDTRSVINAALREAKAALEADGIELVVDQDTRNRTGKRNIDAEVLDKIRRCDIFLADLTPVVTYNTPALDALTNSLNAIQALSNKIQEPMAKIMVARPAGKTTNPTLEVFDLDLCDQLDNLAQTDGFVKDRVEKAVNATPDFEVEYSFKDYEQKVITQKAYVEVKSLAFAEGNLQYRKVQNDAFENNIKTEEQRKRGKQISSSILCVSPLGDKDKGLSDEIEILIKKIDQNIKEDQYKYGSGDDTLLLVDLGQYVFPFNEAECLPVYPDLHRKAVTSGLLWMIAFGRMGDRVYTFGEFIHFIVSWCRVDDKFRYRLFHKENRFGL